MELVLELCVCLCVSVCVCVCVCACVRACLSGERTCGSRLFAAERSVAAAGSRKGGTMLTITGGGFPINPADVVVTVGGARCRVATATLEVS